MEVKEAKAILKNYHQPPRKVRLIADMIRGKSVEEALMLLQFTVKRAAKPVRQLVESAARNAKETINVERDELHISRVMVDKGLVMKRFRAGARGRAYPILKRSSHVTVFVALQDAHAEPQHKKSKQKSKKSVARDADK